MPRTIKARSRASERELDALMDRLSRGDREAFEPLFRELGPRAVRLSRRSVAASEVPDVAQTILLKVFARASDFRIGEPVLPWFYAIAANEIRTVTRRVARARRFSAENAEEEVLRVTLDAISAEDELIQWELLQTLEAAVAELDGPAAEAIAAMLGRAALPRVAAPAFRKRVSRAYARLRRLLHRMG